MGTVRPDVALDPLDAVLELTAEVERLKEERLKAVNTDADTIREALVDYGRLIEENEQLRAQAARLAEAASHTFGELQALQTTAALAGLPAQTWAGFGGRTKKALASTDARKWMCEQKIAELERVAKEMKRDRWDAETTCIEARIAELRREEGA